VKKIKLDLAATNVRLSLEDRIIEGDITVYDIPSSSQKVIFHAGALTPRQPLSHVKLLRDHNMSDPVGYMQSVDDAVQHATFYVAPGENGDRALEEAANGLRDGLSVGFLATEYAFDDDYNFHVYESELFEVSLCAIPDMNDARVTNLAASLAAATQEVLPTMNRQQLAAALAAGTITQATHDTETAKLDAGDRALAAALAAQTANPFDPAPVPAVPVELAAGPQAIPGQNAAPAQVIERGLSLAEVTRRVALAVPNGAQAVALALTDIVPADDAGEAFVNRPDWIGELFRARQINRPWIDSFGVPLPLTSMRRQGYRITGRPRPEKYAGNKTAVPSKGKLTTEPAEFGFFRWAGGWDIDRAFVDFSDEAYLTAFWGAATEEYQVDSDNDIAAAVLAAAAVNESTATDALSGMLALAARVRRIKGAQLNRIVLADDLFDEFASLTKDELPFWLQNASTDSINVLDGTLDLAQLHITSDSEVPDGNIVGYDSRGAAVREKSPIQVRAFDIAKGGIDLGFYSYGAFELYDERLFQSVAVAGAAPVSETYEPVAGADGRKVIEPAPAS
jgi:HK97 family phage prohead protease